MPPFLATVLRVIGTLLLSAAVLLLLFGWFGEAMSEYPRQHREAAQFSNSGIGTGLGRDRLPQERSTAQTLARVGDGPERPAWLAPVNEVCHRL